MSLRVPAAVLFLFLYLVGCSQDPTAPAEVASTSIVEVASATSERRLEQPAATGQAIPRVRFARIPRQPNVTDVEFDDPSLAILGGVPISVTLGVRGSAGVDYGDVIRKGPSSYRVQATGHFIDDWQGETVFIRVEYGEPGGKPVRSSSFDVFVLKNGDAPLQAPRLTDLRVIKDGKKGFSSIIRVTVGDDPAGRVASVKLDVTPIDGASPALTVEGLPPRFRTRSVTNYDWALSSAEPTGGAPYLLTLTMFDADGKPVGTALVEATDFANSPDRWLTSLNGRLLFDDKQGWSLVVTVAPRKGLGRLVEKVSGKITGVADAIAPKPDVIPLQPSGNDAEGRQVFRFSGLKFEKDPRGSLFQVDLEFTFSQPDGRGGTRIRYGQCWVFAGI